MKPIKRHLVLGTKKRHTKMCSSVTQHKATDVSSFEGAYNWHADCRTNHIFYLFINCSEYNMKCVKECGLFFGLSLWPRTPALLLSSLLSLRLPPRKAILTCHDFLPSPGSLPIQDLIPSPGYPLLLGTLLGPVVVGSSVTIVIMNIGPRRSVRRVPHVY